MNLLQIPPDGGMLYAETNMAEYFPEPLNAITSLLFLGIAIYWTFVLIGKGRQHVFLSFAVVLLYIGGIGGAIYHGLRQWSIFIMRDWLPIMLLFVFAGVYFIAKLTRWYYAIGLVAAYVVFQFYARGAMMREGNIQLFININYAVLAAIVLFPVLGYLISTKFSNAKWVGVALAAFIIALTCRVADGWGGLIPVLISCGIYLALWRHAACSGTFI